LQSFLDQNARARAVRRESALEDEDGVLDEQFMVNSFVVSHWPLDCSKPIAIRIATNAVDGDVRSG
jgi:hypothetical protein